jgi:hypothetical protein
LLGLDNIKPFECVGTAEEMIVAMSRAEQTHQYDGDVAMQLFHANFSSKGMSFAEMEKRVFSLNSAPPIPEKFNPQSLFRQNLFQPTSLLDWVSKIIPRKFMPNM